MKVSDGTSVPPTDGSKIQDQTSDGDPQTVVVIPGGTDPENSKFASVLDRVTRSHKENDQRPTKQQAEGPPTLRFVKPRKEERVEDLTNVAEPDRVLAPGIAVPGQVDPPDVHAIVNTTDLDRIVAACNVQLTQGGQQQVTLDLSRSVLDGLRIKLTADGGGRVSAEFLAGSDGVKSLLDARSHELISLLNSRGVELANFRTSLTTDAGTTRDQQHKQGDNARIEFPATKSESIDSMREAVSNPFHSRRIRYLRR